MRHLFSLIALSLLLLAHASPLHAAESVWDGKTIATSFYSGTGTKSDPYTIYTASQFAYFYKEMANGRTFEGQYISLKNDIDMTNVQLSEMDGVQTTYFSFHGNFNGEDHHLAVVPGSVQYSSAGPYIFGSVYGTVYNVIFSKYKTKIATVCDGGELYNCSLEKTVMAAIWTQAGGTVANCYCCDYERWQNGSKYGGAYGLCTGSGNCYNCQFTGMTYISYGNSIASNYGGNYSEYNGVSDEEHNQWVNEHNTTDRTYKPWPMTFNPTYPSYTMTISFLDESGFTNYSNVDITSGNSYTLPIPSGFESEFLGWEVNGEIVTTVTPTDNIVCKAVWKHSFVQQPTFLNPTVLPQDKSKAKTQWYYMAAAKEILRSDITSIEVKYDNSILEFDYSATSSSGGYSTSGYSGYISVDGTTIASCHDGYDMEGHYQIVLSKGQHTIYRSHASTYSITLSCPSVPVGTVNSDKLELSNITPANGVYYCEATYGTEKIYSDILDTSELFYVDGIMYSVIGESKAAVLKIPTDAMTCIIPPTVTNNDVEYTVTEISDYAFSACANLKELTCFIEDIPQVPSALFKDTKCQEGTLYVPISSAEAYKIADGWKEWGTISHIVVCTIEYSTTDGKPITLSKYAVFKTPDGKNISSYDHTYQNGVGKISFSNQVAYFGSVFSKASTLKSITMPESITIIGGHAFEGCSSLTSITIPNSVTKIEEDAFSGCIGLTSIAIPEGASCSIAVFENCSNLQYVILPSTTNVIYAYCFSNCTSLRAIVCNATTPPDFDNCDFSRGYESIFKGVDKSTCIIYVPENSVDAYKGAFMWKNFCNIMAYTPDIDLEDDSDTGSANIPDTDISGMANTIYFDNCETFCGKTIELPIKMKNDIVATGFQFDIILPEGITAEQDEEGFYDITLSTERTTATKTNTFDSSLMSDGSIRVLAASTRNYPFSGNDGEVCIIKLNVSEDLPAGDYPIILKNIELTNAQGQTWNVDRLKRTISVKDYQLGDANGDGRVSVGDFSAVANHILGTTPEDFNLGAADANQDNNISVGDLSTIATMILSNENSGASKVRAKAPEELSDPNNYIYADPVVISEDGDATIVFNMKNEIAATGFQFNFKLPEGFEVSEDEDGFLDVFLSQIRTTSRKTNTFDCVKWDDGSYRVLAASTKNYEFSGNDGEVVTVHIQRNAEVESGDYELLLTDIELTNASGETFRNSKAVYTITVPSNSNEIALIDGEAYDNPTTTNCDALTFSKTFSASAAGKWNAFYVPMSVNVEEYAGELEFAEIYAFCAMRDTNGDGTIDANDENVLFVCPLTSGLTKPNVPYLIRPREAKTYVINSADNVLYAAAQGIVEFATARDKFTVTGLYEPFTVVAGDNNYYVSSTGSLDYRTTGSTTVKANRWVMHRESKEYGGGSGNSPAASSSYRIVAIGEDIDEPTAIKMINAANERGVTNVEIYSLDGRKVNNTRNLRNGLYIKNNQKIIVK